MKYAILIVFLTSMQVFAQEDSLKTQRLPVANISLVRLSRVVARPTRTFLRRKDIEALQAEDLGDIVRKFEGTTLKSYGGLGGLKTVSVRSLGGQHTTVCVDGFNLMNHQTGQVNLGQLQTDNIETVVFSKGNQVGIQLPVSARISGSNLFVKSFENAFGQDSTLSVRANVKYGSFEQKDGYASLKYTGGKWFVSGFGKFRDAAGDYRYRYQNGFQEFESIRANSDYRDFFFGGTAGVRWKSSRIRMGYKQRGSDQGLPGAVILYNSTADERLSSSNQTIFSDYMFSSKNEKLDLRWYATMDWSDLRYQDPTFLNNSGGIDVTYLNRVLNTGLTAYFRPTKSSVLFVGTEQTLSDLRVDDSTFASPLRWHNASMLGGNIHWKWLFIQAMVSSQMVNEENRKGTEAKDQFSLNPYVSMTSMPKGKWNWRHQVWYRNSFRMPSFNELYYNNIGNLGLVPEKAHQFNYNLSFVPIEKKFDWHIRANAFFNKVTDKIVAVPNKNLFIWTIQNVGKVDVYGFELISDIQWTLSKNWKLRNMMNYTFQRSLDRTNVNSATYGHQIAYIPFHTANADLSVEFRSSGLRFSNYFVSYRYALNENISINEVNGFIISDISVYHRFKLPRKNVINLQLNIKNLWDSSYEYIRSYVMPGRNFLISLSYAFN